jgi:hypothetical protein
MKSFLSAICFAATIGFVASAFAQTPQQTMPPSAKKERSAKSIECSRLADEKGLHGKARHKFRSECKHGKI